MEYQEIKLLLETPAVRILRASNAALVLGFFGRAFKRPLRVSIAEGELQAMLAGYLDELRATNPEAYPGTAAEYLNRWCEPSYGYLRKYYGEDREEPLYELTSGAEKALVWLESLQDGGFVGTESRLQSIFNGLDEILKFANGDAEQRIEQLMDESRTLLAEIDRIRLTGDVRTFTPVEINERFALVLATARELLGDFRLVEENFKRIARDIAAQHATPGVTKGAIVGHMLDAHGALRQSDQGQSFFAFWELLISEERRRRFEDTLSRVMQLEALDETLRESTLLPQLISHLLVEGEKVVGSHQRMSANLRRVLDAANVQDRLRVQELIHDILGLALAVKDGLPEVDSFFELNELPIPYAAMSRPLWQSSEAALLSGVIEAADGEIGLEELRRFRNLPQIRLQELTRNVEACLSRRPTVTLQQVLDTFPPRQGMMEVLGYLILATGNRRHIVSDEVSAIELPPPTRQRWRVPLVLFCRE
jgi:hypothetical protein